MLSQQSTVAAGGILGGIFGLGISVGFASMWDFLSTLGVPLTHIELLGLVLRAFNPLTLLLSIGIGVFFGWCVSAVTVLRGIPQMGCLALLVFFSYSFVWLPLIPLIVGFLILVAYNRWLHMKRFALLAFVLGLAVGYIPWDLNGAWYPEAVRSTNRYAQSQNLAPYRVAVNGLDSLESETEIHLSDGTVLMCTLQTINWDDIECVE